MQGGEQMSDAKFFSRGTKAGFVIAALLFAAGLVYFTKCRMTRVETLPPIKVRRTTAKFPDSVSLSRRSVDPSIRDHLLDGDFRVVNRWHAIPEKWRSTFGSSFVSSEGATVRGDAIDMADPDQPFQVSDSIVPGLSFRRLVFAGLSPKRAFIYYQHGGSMYPAYCLAVMDAGTSGDLWVGEARRASRNLEDLRSMLSRGLFDDTSGSGC